MAHSVRPVNQHGLARRANTAIAGAVRPRYLSPQDRKPRRATPLRTLTLYGWQIRGFSLRELYGTYANLSLIEQHLPGGGLTPTGMRVRIAERSTTKMRSFAERTATSSENPAPKCLMAFPTGACPRGAQDSQANRDHLLIFDPHELVSWVKQIQLLSRFHLTPKRLQQAPSSLPTRSEGCAAALGDSLACASG